MNDFKNSFGSISNIQERQTKTGTKMWAIDFIDMTTQINLNGSTFDDPNDPKCQGAIKVGYTEKQNGKFLNRTFYLPNHVKREGGPTNYPAQNPPMASATDKEYFKKLIAEHEAKYHAENDNSLPNGLPW